jgi:hypothetical protein
MPAHPAGFFVPIKRRTPMKTFKSTYDVEQLRNDPVHSPIYDTVKELVVPVIAYGPVSPDAVIMTAKNILARKIRRTDVFSNPKVVSDYLVTKLSGLEHEVFACLFLDTRHRLIAYEELFRGTIDGASVHPRET